MRRDSQTLSLVVIAFATWATAGFAAAEKLASESLHQKSSVSATVEKVDQSRRDLSLKDERGNQFMVQVPEAVSRFETIKKGDRVNLDFYESVALSLKKPSATGAGPSVGESTTTERAPGKLPGGLVARSITASAEVMKVDRTDNKVTIKAPSGDIDTVKVSDAGMQADLAKLKVGDRIQLRYTQAVAVSVTPKEK